MDELSATAAAVGVESTPQALEQRFTPEAAEMLKLVLDAAVEQVIAVDPLAVPLLERFNGVYVQDSRWISLPEQLASVWRGFGGTQIDNNSSAAKIQLRWELLTGALCHLSLHDGTAHDCHALTSTSLKKESLRLADLGYVSLDELKALSGEQIFWLTRIQAMCAIFDTAGHRMDLAYWLNRQSASEVQFATRLGVESKLPCRLLALQVSFGVAEKRRRQLRQNARRKGRMPSKKRLALADWTLFATNVPEEKLTVKEAMVLYRVRWQIELLFKRWKSQGCIDEWRSDKPWRILCELYAKLCAMIIQHWVLLCGGLCSPLRSLHKAAKTVANHALHLACAFASGCVQTLVEALTIIRRCLAVGCRIYQRRNEPSMYQLLLAITDESPP